MPVQADGTAGSRFSHETADQLCGLEKAWPLFRIYYERLAAGQPVNGVISGDIWIKGGGDPLLRPGEGLSVGPGDQRQRGQANRRRYFCGQRFFSAAVGTHLPGQRLRGRLQPVVVGSRDRLQTVTIRITLRQRPARPSASMRDLRKTMSGERPGGFEEKGKEFAGTSLSRRDRKRS